MPLRAALFLSAALLPVPAAALSPEEVRDLVLASSEAEGLTISLGESRREGDTLILSDVILRMTDGEAALSQAVPEVRLRDLGGGRVEMTGSPEATLVGRFRKGDIRGRLRQNGFRALLEGPADSPDSTLSIDWVEAEVSVVEDGGERDNALIRIEASGLAAALGLDDRLPVRTSLDVGRLTASAEVDGPGKSGEATLDLTGLALGHDLSLPPALLAAILEGPPAGGEMREIGIAAGAEAALRLSLDSLAIKAAIRGGESFRFDLSASSGALDGALTARVSPDPVAAGMLPAADLVLAATGSPAKITIDASDRNGLEKMFVRSESGGGSARLSASLPPGRTDWSFDDGPPRGMTGHLSITEDAVATEFAFDFPDQPSFSGHGRYDDLALTSGFDTSGISYDVSVGGLDYAMASADLPAPVAFSAAKAGIGFTLPAYRDPAPQPARMRIDLRDLRLSDGLWQVFDPRAILPRDPLRLTLDAGAMVTVIGNVFTSAGQSRSPFRADSVTLKELALTGLGAAISGSGAVTLSYPEGSDEPEPEGAMAFRATGVYALIDRLSSLGWVTGDDLTGLRMGLAMIAKPAGDDVLISDFRFGPNGRVTVNGMKMK